MKRAPGTALARRQEYGDGGRSSADVQHEAASAGIRIVRGSEQKAEKPGNPLTRPVIPEFTNDFLEEWKPLTEFVDQ